MMATLSLDSYRSCITSEWATEYHFRNIPNAMDDIKECKMKHGIDATDFDEASWEEINKLRFEIAKDSTTGKSLLTRAREALDMMDYDAASDMQIVIQTKVEELKKKYADYKRNLF
jgi:glutamine synthetase